MLNPAIPHVPSCRHGFPDIPVKVLWGDNIADDAPTLSRAELRIVENLALRRPKLELDWLPDAGIRGNGQMLIMEHNNDLIARRVMDWLSALLGTSV